MSGVDVLAVMDRLGTGTVTRHEIETVRAAVAELIENCHALSLTPHGHVDSVLYGRITAMTAALARVTGGSA